jgi:uncharacterized protein
MFKRPYYQAICDRMNEPRKFIQVLAGPRQVGKTTLINQFCKETKAPFSFYTLDSIPAINGSYISECWDTVRMQIKANQQQEHILIFDEIQKINNWSEFVKKEWDADTWNDVNIKVILLGSSRMLIQKGLTESLVGRFDLIRIPHWSYKEMKDAFGWNMNQYMYFGSYPGAADLIKDETHWRQFIKDTMIEPTISKDILMLTPITKPTLMRQMFELGCAYSGQILSMTKMLGELKDAGNTTTLTGYLHLLDESGMLAGIEKYAGNIIRKKTSIPKFQVYNNALRNVYSEFNFTEAQQNGKVWGRIYESAIGAHLLNYVGRDGLQLYYWREGNDEVDFILERNRQTIAIEVKSGKDTKNTGLELFRQKYNPKSCFYVGTGGMPAEDFLSTNPCSLF